MSETTINSKRPPSTRGGSGWIQRSAPSGRRSRLGLPILFLLVFGAQFAFGMWMNSLGFVSSDAYSRAANALMVLYSTDSHLAAVGFVWMPLPTLIEILWVAFYPLWPEIVSSGFASTFTTALAGGATAALLLYAAGKLGLPGRLGWAFALLVSANPMLFLYGGNGMSEGVAAPFLVGAVCFLTLFWHTSQRRYVVASALALALGFASLYEAVPYGAALFVALVLGLLWGSEENREAAAQGRLRAVEALGIVLLAPSLYVAVLWVGANAVIMKDPLFFATSEYSSAAVRDAATAGMAPSEKAEGNVLATLGYVAWRVLPFLIPGGFLLLARALDGRLKRINTLSLALLMLSVPFGLIGPFVYLGLSFGWLRFFMYPLFVAAGWGLYEVVQSRHRERTAALVLAGWVVAAPIVFWAMANPGLGQEEHWQVESLLTGKNADQIVQINQKGEKTSFSNWLDDLASVVRYLEKGPFSEDRTVAVDAFQRAAIAAQTQPEHLRNLLLTPDRKFKRAIANPRKYNISYLLVPNPEEVPQDAINRINRAYPKLWVGEQKGFELVKSFTQTPQEWRLYRVVAPGTGELERNEAQLKFTQNQMGEAEYVGKVGEIQAQSVEAVTDSDDKLLRYDALTADDVKELEANRVTLRDLTDRIADLDPPRKYEDQYEVFRSAIDELYEATELAHRLVAHPISASQADFIEYRDHVDRAAARLQRSNEILGRDYETIEGTHVVAVV